MAHGEVDIGLVVGGGIERTLDEVLLHRCACALGIVVEKEHALGQLSVVESLLEEHVGHHLLILAFLDEVFDALALVLTANGVERIVEGKLLDVAEILLFKWGSGGVVVGIKECKHILEHA